MPLKLIAALFGALLVLTRLPWVLWPAHAKKFIEKHFVKRSDKALQAIGLVCLLLALLFFYIILGILSVAEVAAVMFAMGLLFASFLFAMPRFGKAHWREAIVTHENTIRVLAGIAVLIGLAILYFVFRG